MDLKLGGLERTTTPEGVYRVLRAVILDGTVPPGGQLRERDIAADLGISRSPLREALTRLEEEGLIVKIPFRGAFVVEVSSHEVAEIASIRLLVEPYAAELALEALRGPERPRLTRTIEQFHRATEDERHPDQHRGAPSVPPPLLRPLGSQHLAQPLERLGDQAAPVPRRRPPLLQRPTRPRRRARKAGCRRAGGGHRSVPTGVGPTLPVSAASPHRGPGEHAGRARVKQRFDDRGLTQTFQPVGNRSPACRHSEKEATDEGTSLDTWDRTGCAECRRMRHGRRRRR